MNCGSFRIFESDWAAANFNNNITTWNRIAIACVNEESIIFAEALNNVFTIAAWILINSAVAAVSDSVVALAANNCNVIAAVINFVIAYERVDNNFIFFICDIVNFCSAVNCFDAAANIYSIAVGVD